jgi:uncharacterized SAM-binding protein YcdF (DUF218 family)
MRLNDVIAPADAIVAMGSNDLSVAHYAAALFHEGLAPILVVSGGLAHQSDLLATGWGNTEAQQFAEAAYALGVPQDAVLIEPNAVNTAENFTLVRKQLDDHRIVLRSALIVHKPYMERRALATGRQLWPDIRLTVTSPPCSLTEYLLFTRSPGAAINVMLGDLQRIEVYGEKKFLQRQVIPETVWCNFHELVSLGFDRHLLSDKQ